MNSRQFERYLIMMSDIVECFYVYSEFRSYLFIGHVYKQTKVLMIDFVSILEMMLILIHHDPRMSVDLEYNLLDFRK